MIERFTTEVMESVGPDEDVLAGSDAALADILPGASPQRYSHDFSLMFNVRNSAYESAEECLEHELAKVLEALRERLREAEECPLEVLEGINSFTE